MVNKKLQVWLPLIFSAVMIAGMFFGYKLHEQTGDNSFLKKDTRTSLQEAIDLIRLKYVDKVSIDSLQNGAIEEMMGQLDPHSLFIPASNLQEVNEDLQGNFEGIGVEFNIFDDTVNIVNVLAGGPSDKAGLAVGDKILKVNDSVITNKNIESEDVKKIIKGERGSAVNLTVWRLEKQQSMKVIRGVIPVPSVDAAYMLDKTSGYIRLNKFSESTYEEFMRSLENLQKEGLQKLVLDLRGNGGGLMKEAVDIADEFLEGSRLIVYTEGKNSPKIEYRCKRPGLFEKGKLIVLVDELSASASEVLTGALQDWDRATIVGRRTFGKGLVQEQYNLSDGSALRLVTARYYTPLGRSIQRPYDKGKKVYMDELWKRVSDGELQYADSNKVQNGKVYETEGHKKLYDGGGIMPDVFVSIDTGKINGNVRKLFTAGILNRFVYKYYLANLSMFNSYKSPADFINKYSDINNAFDRLAVFAAKDSVNLKSINTKDKEQVLKSLKSNMARTKWRSNGFYEVINAYDTTVKKALEELRK
jgi:carboxyl-terminal processing protease